MRLHAPATAILALAAALAASPASMAAEPIDVVIDHAKVIHAPEGTSTLVVGNPLIADTSIQRNNVIVLTGKSFGTTNLLALDSQGKTIREMIVRVRGQEQNLVTVHRGVERESYSCAPVCEQTLKLGDSSDYFSGVGGQYGARNTYAQSQGDR